MPTDAHSPAQTLAHTRREHLAALLGLGSLLAGGCASAPSAPTWPLRVFSSGGFFAAYDAMLPSFERESGIPVQTERGASGGGAPDSIPERLARGERADVVILSRGGFRRLAEAGFVVPESRIDLVRSKIGMAVREGAPIPDISTPDAFVAALRAARSIGYSASASGTYLSADLWPRMGLWAELAPNARRIESERVASVVARGEVEVGFQQISEILPIPGAAYAGPIPEDLQKTTVFSAGLVRGGDSVRGTRLLRFVSDPARADLIRSVGLEPVNL